jgi:hypothetical protein
MTRKIYRSEVDSGQSEAELLRAIKHDVRAVYDEILRKPLPRDIQAVLFRLDAVEDLEGQEDSRRMLVHAD